MAEPTTVEHVFGKRTDDPDNLRLLNSLRYYNKGRFLVKDWSPEIHRHEMANRKREREEKYIKSLQAAPKPVMLVQKKEVYHHVPLSKSVSPLIHNEAFYKVSGESRPIQSVAHEVLKGKVDGAEKVLSLTRKQKSVPTLTRRLQTPDKINRIAPKPVVDPANELEFVKIEGLEFLPDGFIELEPVLFHDEFRFAADRDRAQFSEDQRHVVAKRRKQYEHRKEKKVRPVTLFVVKDFIQDLDAFFEAWFSGNKRRMTEEEVEYLAKELDVKREAVLHMQDEFLRKKKQKNANTLDMYFQGRDFQSMEKLARLPRFLQEYFFNFNKQDYSHVKSKHMDVHKKKPEGDQAMSKKSSNVTFRAPSKTDLGVTDKGSKFFEATGTQGLKVTSASQNLKITMEQIVDGSSTLKIRDFRPDVVEGVPQRSLAQTQHTQSQALTAPDSIEYLNELLEDFQREKMAHTKHQNRDLPANCETRLDKNFHLMNCKITLQTPVEGAAAAPKKQFKKKVEGK